MGSEMCIRDRSLRVFLSASNAIEVSVPDTTVASESGNICQGSYSGKFVYRVPDSMGCDNFTCMGWISFYQAISKKCAF